MQAILLAGGHATRLWPITRDRPKPLLPLGEDTILHRLLDTVVPIADDVIVSTNELFEAEFRAAIEDVPKTSLFVEGQASEEEKPGALGALFEVADELDPDDPLLVVAGDNYYGFDMGRFAKEAADREGPSVAVKKLERREDARAFGVVEMGEATRIDAFHEKPEDPPSNLAATALYYYPPEWDRLFDAYEAHARKAMNTDELFDEPGRILEWGVTEGIPVHAWPFEQDWFDIGTQTGYLDALTSVVGDRYVEGTLEDCQEGEGIFVFEDAKAKASRLERTVLLPGAQVENASLTETIVDSHAHVEDVTLTGSMVGTHDQIRGDQA